MAAAADKAVNSAHGQCVVICARAVAKRDWRARSPTLAPQPALDQLDVYALYQSYEAAAIA